MLRCPALSTELAGNSVHQDYERYIISSRSLPHGAGDYDILHSTRAWHGAVRISSGVMALFFNVLLLDIFPIWVRRTEFPYSKLSGIIFLLSAGESKWEAKTWKTKDVIQQ